MEFESWSKELDKVKTLRGVDNFNSYVMQMDAVTGQEKEEYLQAILNSVCCVEDYGAYESTYNAVWRFPPAIVGRVLAEILPDFWRRMGSKANGFQVYRFYVVVPTTPEAFSAFVTAMQSWNKTDAAIGRKVLKKWYAQEDDDEWEKLYLAAGGKLDNNAQDPIPKEWPAQWQEQTHIWREATGEKARLVRNQVFDLKKPWNSTLDFTFAFLSLNHGTAWRDTESAFLRYTNNATSIPAFMFALSQTPENTQTKVLSAIKRCGPFQYKQLVKSGKVLEKIKSAADACVGSPAVLQQALFKDIMQRANAYANGAAEAVYLHLYTVILPDANLMLRLEGRFVWPTFPLPKTKYKFSILKTTALEEEALYSFMLVHQRYNKSKGQVPQQLRIVYTPSTDELEFEMDFSPLAHVPENRTAPTKEWLRSLPNFTSFWEWNEK